MKIINSSLVATIQQPPSIIHNVKLLSPNTVSDSHLNIALSAWWILCRNHVADFTFQTSLNLIIIKEIVTVKISFTVSPSLRLPVLKLLGSSEHFTIFISIRGYLLMNRIMWSVNYKFIIYQHFFSSYN